MLQLRFWLLLRFPEAALLCFRKRSRTPRCSHGLLCSVQILIRGRMVYRKIHTIEVAHTPFLALWAILFLGAESVKFGDSADQPHFIYRCASKSCQNPIQKCCILYGVRVI